MSDPETPKPKSECRCCYEWLPGLCRYLFFGFVPIYATGGTLLLLLLGTHERAHTILPGNPETVLLSDALVLFFATVAFIASIALAWNMRKGDD